MAISRDLLAGFLIVAGSGSLVAQTGVISGRVVDATSATAISGATIQIEELRRSTTTGVDGTFRLADVPVGTHRVTARVIGYGPVTQQVSVQAGQTTALEFSLERQVVVMDAVVVTGYGAQRRAEITGSVASVDATEADVGVISNPDELIQGRVAGVHITQNHGEPGAGVQIRVRGGTSISASNEPLYVIDGVPVQNLPTEPGGVGIGGSPALPRNPLNLINPKDVESITVLKDASAAAIYGARGANGVILIETKQGVRDRTVFEYDGYVSVATPARRLDLLNGDEYRAFIQDQVAAGTLPATRLSSLGSANTDWEREVTRSAVMHNHNLSFSGGTEATQYRASLNYMNQQGVALSSGWERFQGRLNGTHYAWNDRLQLRVNLTSSHVRHDYLPFENTGGFEGGVFQNMVVFNPTQPVMVADPATGDSVFYEIGTGRQSVRNPVAMARQILDFANTTRTLGNVRAQLDVLSNLHAQLIVGVDRSESIRRTYFPKASPVGAEWNGRALQESRELTGVTFQSLLTFREQFAGVHDLEVVAGYEFNDYTIDLFGADARDFLTDAFGYDNLSAGAQREPPFSYREDRRLVGFFGRAVWGFRDRYFLTGVLRRDGSSRFGADNKWATFPAISASWRIGEEDFMATSPFSELRLRVGYGLQGNEAVPAYASLITLAPGDRYVFGNTAVVGVAPTRNPNPSLKWEKTSQFNVAVDYGLANNRISGSFEYYVKNTSDLLLEVTVPQPAIVERRFENIGKVRNSGLEATFDALLINKANVTFEAGLVFAAERNEVVDLGGRNFITTGFVSGQGQSGQVSQRILPGHPLGTFYGPEYVGVDNTGKQLFNQYQVQRDSLGREISRTLIGTTTTPSGDDFVPIGDANPDFTVGIRGQLAWGRLDASFIGRWEQGRDVFNNTALVYSTKGNALQDKNFLKAALADPIGINEPAIFSSRWIEDGSFFRLQNVTVGYRFDLPAFISTARAARVYVSSDNLLLLSGYSGYDPEAHSESGLASRGIDYLSYPRARTFTAGLQLSF